VPQSRLKKAVAKLLEREGFIEYVTPQDVDGKPSLKLGLKYHNERPVIEMLKRVSKPGLRQYRGVKQLPKVQGGLGIAIVSTSKGIVTDKEARKLQQGGEILAEVS
jgi:small subunit ribosomal protein S8